MTVCRLTVSIPPKSGHTEKWARDKWSDVHCPLSDSRAEAIGWTPECLLQSRLAEILQIAVTDFRQLPIFEMPRLIHGGPRLEL